MNISRWGRPQLAVWIAAFGAVVLVGMAIQWRGGASSGEASRIEPVVRPVKTVRLARDAGVESRSFPGLVQAVSETQLAFRVSGPLVALDAQIGQRVEKGAVIARIDSRDFEIQTMRLSAALKEARANLKAMRSGARPEDIVRLEAGLMAARTRLANAKTDFKRQESLLADRAVAQARYDNARATLDSATASVEMLVQELKMARSGARAENIEAAEAGIQRLMADAKAAGNALEDTVLKAPFSGIVSRRFVENFENVRAGSPVVSFLDVSRVEVHAAVPEDLIIRRTAISEISCSLDAYPGRRFPAAIKELGLKTDSANQSYPLTVVLQLPDALVVEPGMAATLNIAMTGPLGQEDGFVLPTGALFAGDDGNSCVWCVDSQTMNVVKTPVTTGALRGETVRILSGLNAGDRVVTAGARFLRDGQTVRLLDGAGGGAS